VKMAGDVGKAVYTNKGTVLISVSPNRTPKKMLKQTGFFSSFKTIQNHCKPKNDLGKYTTVHRYISVLPNTSNTPKSIRYLVFDI
jgi:hypothetical protein